jgi:AcrR family transcriptional regulator
MATKTKGKSDAQKAEQAAGPASPKKKRRPRMSGEERRAQILEAAKVVFVRSGLGGARTRELAKEAGVNEATLFAHFASKEDLFEEAIVKPLEQLASAEQVIGDNYKAAKSVEEQRAINLEAHRRMLQTVHDIFPLLMTALFSDSERGRQFYNDHMYPWFQAAAASGRQTFAGKPRKHLNTQMANWVPVGAYMVIVMDHYFRNARLDMEEAIKTISSICESGLFEH